VFVEVTKGLNIQGGVVKTASLHCCNDANSNPYCQKTLHTKLEHNYVAYVYSSVNCIQCI